MKANRKFPRAGDEAVSPVIGVILMVAITVVLAATVYVWVSGFGGQGSAAAKSISLTGNGPIAAANATDETKAFTVASATPGLKWSDLRLQLDGTTLECRDAWTGAADAYRVKVDGAYLPCGGAAPDRVVGAGHALEVYDDGGGLSGKTLRLVDPQANSVLLTVTIG